MRADVLLAPVVQGVVVPAGEAAGAERRPDEAAGALREYDGIGDGLHVPLILCLGRERPERFGDLGRGEAVLRGEEGEVDKLFRVGGEVIELGRVGGTGDVFPRSAFDHHHRGDSALTAVLGEYSIRSTLSAFEVREERGAVHGEAGPELLVHQINQGREDIEGRDVGGDTMGFECRRVVDYQRHPDRRFKVRHLVPQPPLAQHVPMVPAEDDNGILVQTAVLQRLKQLANVVVYVRDSPVVCSPCPLDLVWSEVLVPEVADLQQTLGVAILVLLRDGNVRQVNVHPLVQVPVLLLDGIWVVGVGEGDGHAEGAGTGALSHVVVEELLAPDIC